MKRSSRPRAQVPEPQPAQPAPISTNGLAVDATHTDRSYAARRAAGQLGLTPQQVLQQQAAMAAQQGGQQFQQPPPQPMPLGSKHARDYVPKPAVAVGAKHARDASGPGTSREVPYRPRMAQPTLREHQRNQGNAQDVRRGVVDAAPRSPGVRAPVQPRGPQQTRPNPQQAAAQAQQPAQAPAGVALNIDPNVERVDVTAIITTFVRPQLLRPQLEALGSGSVAPAMTWVWNNADGSIPIDRDALRQAQVMFFGTNGNHGGWPRLLHAMLAETEYVLFLDDDCIPGGDWLRRAVERLGADPKDEPGTIIACEGVSFSADDPGSLFQVGSETEDVEVDMGLRGWLMSTATAANLVTIPHPPGVDGMPLFLGAAGAALGCRTIVLSTPTDSTDGWGAINEPEVPSLSTALPDYMDRFAAAYSFYREQGWAPIVAAQESGEQQEEAPEVQATVDPA